MTALKVRSAPVGRVRSGPKRRRPLNPTAASPPSPPAAGSAREWARSCETRAGGGRGPLRNGSTRRDLRGGQPEERGGRLPALLLGRVAGALPGHEHPVVPQQRRRVLHQHGKSRHRARRDRVVRLTRRPRAPPASAPTPPPAPSPPARCRDLAAWASRDHRRLAPGRLDQVHLRAGQRDRQRQPRKARPRRPGPRSVAREGEPRPRGRSGCRPRGPGAPPRAR